MVDIARVLRFVFTRASVFLVICCCSVGYGCVICNLYDFGKKFFSYKRGLKSHEGSSNFL